MSNLQVNGPQAPSSEDTKEDNDSSSRKVEKYNAFEIVTTDEGYKCIDNYLTVREKIGEGGFCKVKHATCKVTREDGDTTFDGQ